jgi:4-alpha-glucanotransferase
MDIDDILRDLAEAAGIEVEFTDNWGKLSYAAPDVVLKILETKGVRIVAQRSEDHRQVLITARDQPPERCSFIFERELRDRLSSSREGTLKLIEENGRCPEMVYSFDWDAILVTGTGCLCRTAVSIPFPGNLEVGAYYFRAEAVIQDAVYHAHSVWFVCPPRAYMPPELAEGARIAGIGLALYGIRSERNWGVGDFSDLRRVVDWAKDVLNVDFIGLNPLHAIFNRRPFNNSPYLPSSRIFRNFIYLDVTAIEDFSDCSEAQDFLATEHTRDLIRRLRNEEHVNYQEVAALKLDILRRLYRTFLENQGKSYRHEARWVEFEEYRKAQGTYLERFATFCALLDHFGSSPPRTSNWRQWPEPFQDSSSESVKRFAREQEAEILFWMYVQWQIDDQLRRVQQYARDKGMLLGLYHDVALGIDSRGADCWAWRGFFHEGFRVGAPPDAFAEHGQDWGIPPVDSSRMRGAAYAPFRKMLEANCAHGGALRIDHVMQFHHLFWIPAGAKAATGVYVKECESDLFNLLALESNREAAVIVGEDLGTLPFNFRERLMAKGILSYRLFYFEQDDHGNMIPFHHYPTEALVSITTHDLPTLAGFWAGCDFDLRRDAGLLDDREGEWRRDRDIRKAKIVERLVHDGFLPEHCAHEARESSTPTDDLHSAVLKFLFHTPSRLVQVNQEDIFLDLRQQNLPGTTAENPNWVTKMRFTVEDLTSHPEAVRLSDKFRRLLEESGRTRNRM